MNNSFQESNFIPSWYKVDLKWSIMTIPQDALLLYLNHTELQIPCYNTSTMSGQMIQQDFDRVNPYSDELMRKERDISVLERQKGKMNNKKGQNSNTILTPALLPTFTNQTFDFPVDPNFESRQKILTSRLKSQNEVPFSALGINFQSNAPQHDELETLLHFETFQNNVLDEKMAIMKLLHGQISRIVVLHHLKFGQSSSQVTGIYPYVGYIQHDPQFCDIISKIHNILGLFPAQQIEQIGQIDAKHLQHFVNNLFKFRNIFAGFLGENIDYAVQQFISRHNTSKSFSLTHHISLLDEGRLLNKALPENAPEYHTSSLSRNNWLHYFISYYSHLLSSYLSLTHSPPHSLNPPLPPPLPAPSLFPSPAVPKNWYEALSGPFPAMVKKSPRPFFFPPLPTGVVGDERFVTISSSFNKNIFADVMGVIVHVIHLTDKVIYHINDGSGVLICTVWSTTATLSQFERQSFVNKTLRQDNHHSSHSSHNSHNSISTLRYANNVTKQYSLRQNQLDKFLGITSTSVAVIPALIGKDDTSNHNPYLGNHLGNLRNVPDHSGKTPSPNPTTIAFKQLLFPIGSLIRVTGILDRTYQGQIELKVRSIHSLVLPPSWSIIGSESTKIKNVQKSVQKSVQIAEASEFTPIPNGLRHNSDKEHALQHGGLRIVNHLKAVRKHVKEMTTSFEIEKNEACLSNIAPSDIIHPSTISTSREIALSSTYLCDNGHETRKRPIFPPDCSLDALLRHQNNPNNTQKANKTNQSGNDNNNNNDEDTPHNSNSTSFFDDIHPFDYCDESIWLSAADQYSSFHDQYNKSTIPNPNHKKKKPDVTKNVLNVVTKSTSPPDRSKGHQFDNTHITYPNDIGTESFSHPPNNLLSFLFNPDDLFNQHENPLTNLNSTDRFLHLSKLLGLLLVQLFNHSSTLQHILSSTAADQPEPPQFGSILDLNMSNGSPYHDSTFDFHNSSHICTNPFLDSRNIYSNCVPNQDNYQNNTNKLFYCQRIPHPYSLPTRLIAPPVFLLSDITSSENSPQELSPSPQINNNPSKTFLLPAHWFLPHRKKSKRYYFCLCQQSNKTEGNYGNKTTTAQSHSNSYLPLNHCISCSRCKDCGKKFIFIDDEVVGPNTTQFMNLSNTYSPQNADFLNESSNSNHHQPPQAVYPTWLPVDVKSIIIPYNIRLRYPHPHVLSRLNVAQNTGTSGNPLNVSPNLPQQDCNDGSRLDPSKPYLAQIVYNTLPDFFSNTISELPQSEVDFVAVLTAHYLSILESIGDQRGDSEGCRGYIDNFKEFWNGFWLREHSSQDQRACFFCEFVQYSNLSRHLSIDSLSSSAHGLLKQAYSFVNSSLGVNFSTDLSPPSRVPSVMAFEQNCTSLEEKIRNKILGISTFFPKFASQIYPPLRGILPKYSFKLTYREIYPEYIQIEDLNQSYFAHLEQFDKISKSASTSTQSSPSNRDFDEFMSLHVQYKEKLVDPDDSSSGDEYDRENTSNGDQNDTIFTQAEIFCKDHLKKWCHLETNPNYPASIYSTRLTQVLNNTISAYRLKSTKNLVDCNLQITNPTQSLNASTKPIRNPQEVQEFIPSNGIQQNLYQRAKQLGNVTKTGNDAFNPTSSDSPTIHLVGPHSAPISLGGRQFTIFSTSLNPLLLFIEHFLKKRYVFFISRLAFCEDNLSYRGIDIGDITKGVYYKPQIVGDGVEMGNVDANNEEVSIFGMFESWYSLKKDSYDEAQAEMFNLNFFDKFVTNSNGKYINHHTKAHLLVPLLETYLNDPYQQYYRYPRVNNCIDHHNCSETRNCGDGTCSNLKNSEQCTKNNHHLMSGIQTSPNLGASHPNSDERNVQEVRLYNNTRCPGVPTCELAYLPFLDPDGHVSYEMIRRAVFQHFFSPSKLDQGQNITGMKPRTDNFDSTENSSHPFSVSTNNLLFFITKALMMLRMRKKLFIFCNFEHDYVLQSELSLAYKQSYYFGYDPTRD